MRRLRYRALPLATLIGFLAGCDLPVVLTGYEAYKAKHASELQAQLSPLDRVQTAAVGQGSSPAGSSAGLGQERRLGPSPSATFFPIAAKANRLRMTLREDGLDDGDHVRIELNGEAVPGLEDVTITSTGRTFELTLAPGDNLLRFIALDEGSKPPTTFAFSVDAEDVAFGSRIQTNHGLNVGENAILAVGIGRLGVLPTAAPATTRPWSPIPTPVPTATETVSATPPTALPPPTIAPTPTPTPEPAAASPEAAGLGTDAWPSVPPDGLRPIKVRSRDLSVLAMDDALEDGDHVRIELNGLVLPGFGKHFLLAAGTRVATTLQPGRNVLRFTALDTGLLGPCTVALEFPGSFVAAGPTRQLTHGLEVGDFEELIIEAP